ncbi:MAG: hypothetical protein PVJ57_01830 [Phycisphaerae bacterium]|jgi:hypothetical protein
MATTSSKAPAFEVAANQILFELRQAFVVLMDQAGLAGIKPLPLARKLGIDKSLAWKIHRVVYPQTSMDVVRHLPGSASIRRFVDAVRAKRASDFDQAQIERAISGLEQIIRTHCGDRATFQMMMNSVADEPSEEVAEQHRQELVRGASYVWGAHARVTMRADFVAPSATPGMVDIASVRGLVDLVRYRPKVPWVLSHMGAVDNDMRRRSEPSRQAIDPSQRCEEAAPLLTEFCSKPPPVTRRVPSTPGLLQDELVEERMGTTGLVTCMTGERVLAVTSRYRDEHNDNTRHRAILRTPSDLLLFDLYVHRDLKSAMNPQFVLYSSLETGPMVPATAFERYHLPAAETVKSLGAFPPMTATPDVPRYADMTAYVFERCGWQAADFAGFRLQMTYPPLPAVAVLQWPLAERPDLSGSSAGSEGPDSPPPGFVPR